VSLLSDHRYELLVDRYEPLIVELPFGVSTCTSSSNQRLSSSDRSVVDLLVQPLLPYDAILPTLLLLPTVLLATHDLLVLRYHIIKPLRLNLHLHEILHLTLPHIDPIMLEEIDLVKI
jgi:hypothetical protein